MSQDFLSQVIRSYGGAMQSFVGNYLEQSLRMFQQPSRDGTSATASPPGTAPNGAPADPFTAMATMARQNYERWIAMQGEFLRAMTAPGASATMRPKETGTPEPLDEEEDEAPMRERAAEHQHPR
jgi:polyhydroxyalkanoate synthesis regulator protein